MKFILLFIALLPLAWANCNHHYHMNMNTTKSCNDVTSFHANVSVRTGVVTCTFSQNGVHQKTCQTPCDYTVGTFDRRNYTITCTGTGKQYGVTMSGADNFKPYVIFSILGTLVVMFCVLYSIVQVAYYIQNHRKRPEWFQIPMGVV